MSTDTIENRTSVKADFEPYTPETFASALDDIAMQQVRAASALRLLIRSIEDMQMEVFVDRPRFDNRINAELEAQGVDLELALDGDTDHGYWNLDEDEHQLWQLEKDLKKALRHLSQDRLGRQSDQLKTATSTSSL